MNKYYVIGYPAGLSVSPTIHLQFAKQTGQNIEYGNLEVKPGTLRSMIADLIEQGARGFNVKYPLKQEAYAMADNISERARIAKSASCLIIDEHGTITAENFDGIAIINDMRHNYHVDFGNKSILVVGAGNTARCMLPELVATKPGNIILTNRTLSKAQQLIANLQLQNHITCQAMADINTPVDIIMNMTAASLDDKVPALNSSCIGPQTICYDVEYNPNGTAFCRWATKHGAKQAIDGFGMTIEHNAILFEQWRGVKPDPKPMFAYLKAQWQQK